MASMLPSDMMGFRLMPFPENHPSAIRRVFPPGSNSKTGCFAKVAAVMRSGSSISGGAINMNSSSMTGVMSKARPDTGIVTDESAAAHDVVVRGATDADMPAIQAIYAH
jgi:hypothetical protein